MTGGGDGGGVGGGAGRGGPAVPGAGRGGPAVPGAWTRLSLRSRLLAIGACGVAATLLASGLLLYSAVAKLGADATAERARTSARDVAALADTGRLPDPVPVTGAITVQVLDARGRVRSASLGADRLTSLLDRTELERALTGEAIIVPGNRSGLSGELVVAAVNGHVTGGIRAGGGDDRVSVVAAVPTQDMHGTLRTLRLGMAVVFPLLLAILSGIAWRVIGSALAPVEALRTGAERIRGDGRGGSRLPVPPARDEIAALAVTLNAMLARLDEAQASQRAFVADAAHELRSPLAVLRTQVEVAARIGDGAELAADLLPELDRLTALVEDLLTLARATDGARVRRPESIDVAQFADDLVARYAAARVPVRRTGRATGSARWFAEPGDALRVAMNVLDNAVRHAAAAVTVHVAGPVLTIADDGAGITSADRERVFERFTRLDEARAQDTGGSGLGLAIALELLRRNGGTITLHDAAPGLAATMAFPLATGARTGAGGAGDVLGSAGATA